MRIRNLIDRIRDSQFFVPALFILVSLGLVAVTNEFDSRTEPGVWYLMPSTVTAARTLLATIAGSIITVAALVFSFSAVTVQLAASQYSPRVVQDFLRNRVQQMVVGVVMGTFTYSLSALATLGSDPADDARADWTASVGVALGVLAALVIVAYIDHVTRRIRIDDTITRIADQTVDAFRRRRADGSVAAQRSWNVTPDMLALAGRSDVDGYVQRVDILGIMSKLPDDAIARLDVWPGRYVASGHRVFTLWGDDQAKLQSSVEAAKEYIDIGGTRDIDHDPGFGFRQLVDIALRALSPGINDPATAADVVEQIVRPLREAHLAGDADRVYENDRGVHLLAPRATQIREFTNMALVSIRRNAAEQPLVLRALVDSISATTDELTELGVPTPELDDELKAATEELAVLQQRFAARKQ